MSLVARFRLVFLAIAVSPLSLPSLFLHAQSPAIYVSPNGDDQAAGTLAAPVRSLGHAVELARQTPQHTVELRGGVYRLSSPLALTAADSGLTLSGHAGEQATLSGGVKLSGWKLVDRARGLWSASFPEQAHAPRQIYVDGVRATRASGRIPVTLTMTKTGYTASNDTLARWKHPEELEFVYTGGNGFWGEPSVGLGSWTEPRCPVASMHGNEITMAEPCWTNSTDRVMLPSGARTANLVGPASIGKVPTHMENAFELLGTPGQFYVDAAAHTIYYTPRHGEDLAHADVEAPVLETLVELQGSSSAPVNHITFHGITFAYAAWNEPSGPEGFSEIQANYRVTGPDGASKQALCDLVPGGTCPFAAWTPEPGNVVARYADDITFTRDTFTHLGAAGLSIARGAHNNLVQGCIFTDISGNGVELAGVDQPQAADADFAIGNRIENNLFRNVGAEYRGGIPIVVGYAQHTRIAHNQIDHIPYAAISIGWGGWPDKINLPGVANRSTGNVIEANRITRLMIKLSDGGGIYTQGRTGKTIADGEIVQKNFIDNQFSSGHAIYTDNGSAMITVRRNVIFNADMDNWGSRHKDYYDGAKGDDNDPLAIKENWWQQGDPDSNAKQVVEQGNHLIGSLSEVPADLISNAGLEPAFRDLRVGGAAVAPEAPTSVAAFLAKDTAYISWRPSVFEGGSSVTRYTVHASNGQQTTLSAEEFDRLSYAKLKLNASSSPLTFAVTASNAAGTSVSSLPSLPVTASSEALPLPGEPQNVAVHVAGTRASIHFGLPKDNAEHLLSYIVTIQPDKEPGKTQTFTGRRIIALEGRHNTFDTVEGLDSTKHYRFGVAAVNPTGTGPIAWAEDHSAAKAEAPLPADLSVAMVESTMRAYPQATSLGKWGYVQSLYLYGEFLVYERTHDPRYLAYIRSWADAHIDAQGKIDNALNALDYMLPGNLLLALYKETGEQKYKLAAQSIRTRLDTYPRTADGGFWHATTRQHQLWLDGTFMSLPFLVRYGEAFGEQKYAYDEASKQLLIYASHLNDPASGLLFHAYDESAAQPWALPDTHHSSYFWARSIGWYGMALIEVLDKMPKDHPNRPKLIALVQQLVKAYTKYQDPQTGLWYNIVDKQDQPGNWLETSASSMYVYTIAKAVERGYVAASSMNTACKGYRGVLTQLSVDSDNNLHIANICEGTNVSDLDYYLQRKHGQDDLHGLGAFLIMNEYMRTTACARPASQHKK